MIAEGEKITQKMKPCPFCGSKELRLWYNRTFGWYSVYCWVCGNARVCGNADCLLIGRIGSRFSFTTFFKNKDKGITVSCGCFLGTIAEFRAKVTDTHGNNKHAKMYNLAADMAELQIRNYDAKDGTKRWVTEIIANGVEFVERKADGGSASGGEKGGMEAFGTAVPFDEEIPF